MPTATELLEADISSPQTSGEATTAPTEGSPLVEFHDLTVSYGPRQALSAVTGAFLPGATGLLGPNGAGKTTLLKTLLGFLKPDRGRMTAFGLDLAVAPLEVRRRVGYMPEVDCHLPGMTASAFVAFAGELSGMPRDEAVSRAHEVLYYVGLDEARYRTVDTYSTGMKQRVKLAQALVHDPDLLLLDEPTNGLDPDGREEMLSLISDVSRRRQMSLILCSHLLRDVERVCESVIVFNQGEVAARGSIAALTGSRRSVYDLRVKGDPAAFLTDLKDQGCEWRENEDGLRLFLADGLGPEAIFRTARECGVQVRYLRPGAESLEDVFLRALGHETQLMPIYDQSYRRYEAREALRRVRFWPITREALRLILARRAFLGLLMIAWVPFLARVIQVYVVTRFPEAGRVLPVDGRLFGEFLAQQSVFTLFLTVFGGAGLIANDLRTGAILVYLSRPLTRRDYVLGKLGVLMALNLSVTLLPGLLLYIIAIALAPAQFLKWELAWLGPAVVAQSIVISLVTSLVALAVSSLSRSARVAGLAFFGLLMGLEVVRGILRAVYDRPEALLVSLTGNMQAVGNALFGIQSRAFDIPWVQPALVLAMVCLGCLAILRTRVRAVEIVR